mgnify:CR=1 FL=1
MSAEYGNAKHWIGDDDREEVCTVDPETCECPKCRQWRAEHRDAGELDGEAFRGGEAAAFEAEQMHAWQRLKR